MKLNEVNIVNRRARFDYEISETFTAGIVLTGTEIKIDTPWQGRSERYVLPGQQR